MKIFVHPAVCDGAGTCNVIAPGYFQLGTDGKSFVKTQEIAEDDVPRLREAERRCPYRAIVLLD